MEVAREGITLLEALREDLGVRSVKDGCSPQGQCGCCTVLVDGAARVSCVTPVRRVAGREVRTVDGLDQEPQERLVGAFTARGASQCGFCTPGILCRLAALTPGPTPAQVETALLAHLCRCTGWRSIMDAAAGTPLLSPEVPGPSLPPAAPGPSAADARATLEGRTAQQMGAEAVRGRGGFADDTAPDGCLVAVPTAAGRGWAVGETLAEARAAAGKVQGRRSGRELSYPIDGPPGEWDLTLQTTWVEPAYLEPDSSWCVPGGRPAPPAGNGGDFGAKRTSPAPAAARRLADEYGRPVRVVMAREDTVRLGAKRPPMGAGVRLDGTGVIRLAGCTAAVPGAEGDADPGLPGPAGDRLLAAAVAAAAPGLAVEHVPVVGPAVSPHLRAAGWAEAAVLRAAAAAASAGETAATVTTPEGARVRAEVELDAAGWPAGVAVEVYAGDPLDPVVLRSYAEGAAHMALGWVCSEGIAVDTDGVPSDLTIRSFGVLRARDTPPMAVTVRPGSPGDGPFRASDAVFAAVAAATWLAQGLPSRWPTRRGTRR